MKIRFKKILIVAILIFLTNIIQSGVPKEVIAQINIGSPISISDELGVEIVPNYPRPNETTSISLALYTNDLSSATISWYKDGQLVLSGKGEVKYSLQMGNVGTESRIEIRVNLLNGVSFSKKFTLNPASIDLIWEADSYVPAFYKGKALHSKQGVLKIVAMPEFVKNGKRISPSNLVYAWGNGVDAYQSQSGYGKNTLILNGSILGKENKVEVLVTDPVNNIVANKFITIFPTDPEILFYENNPYYGHNFEQAISNFSLKTAEVQVLAVPFYFSQEAEGGLTFNWKLNGLSVPSLTESRTAIFKKPDDKSGRSNISLTIENQNRILQQADANLIMQFEN